MFNIAQTIIDIISFLLTLSVTILLWILILLFCIIMYKSIRDYLRVRGDGV
mgnify:CR=1 FL=1